MISIYIENTLLQKGAWVELPDSITAIKKKVSLSDDQEYLITDYEAPFQVKGNDDLDFLNELAERLEEVESDPAFDYLEELISNGYFSDISSALDEIDMIRVYSDCYSFKDYAEQFIDEMGYLSGLPDIVAYNIDYEGIGIDLKSDGNLYQADNNVILEVLN